MPLTILIGKGQKGANYMSGINNVSFGALTAKIKFENFDLDKNGYITQEELQILLGKEQYDILDLSTMGNGEDIKITQKDYEIWQQESIMIEQLDAMKAQAARDLVGQDVDDIKNFIEAQNNYEQDFIEKYSKTHNDVSGMAKEFIKELPQKYNELKRDALTNNKAVMTERVINNVIENFMEIDKKIDYLIKRARK